MATEIIAALVGATLSAAFALIISWSKRHTSATAEKNKDEEQVRRDYEHSLDSMILDIRSNMTVLRSNQLLLERVTKELTQSKPYRSYPAFTLFRKDLLEDCINKSIKLAWFSYCLKLETFNLGIGEYNDTAKEIFGEIAKLQFSNSEINIDIVNQAFESLLTSIESIQSSIASCLEMHLELYAEINVYKRHIHDMVEDNKKSMLKVKKYTLGSSVRKLNLTELMDYRLKDAEYNTELVATLDYYNNVITKAVKAG